MEPDLMTAYQRAEFSKSARLRVWLFMVQLLAAAPGALSVIVTDPDAQYYLAVAATSLIAIWWMLSMAYERARSAAQAARRASLLLGLFPGGITANESKELRQRFTVTEERARSFIAPGYYASKEAPSAKRLCEMLEESAYFTADLQRFSAQIMLALFGAFVLVAGVLAISIGIDLDRSASMNFVRVTLAASIFLMSSDVLGATLKHRAAAREVEAIRRRLAILAARGTPLTDILLVMTDYNAAVESAPESVPFAFKCREGVLNQRWAEYVKDKAAEQALARQ